MGFHRDLEGLDLHSPSYLKVKNETGTTLTKGKVVRFDGLDADGLIKAVVVSSAIDRVIGVVSEDISNTYSGKIAAQARLNGVDTSAFSENDLAYSDLSGNFTATDTGLLVGIVLKVGLLDGSIFVLTALKGEQGASGTVDLSGVLLVKGGETLKFATIALAIAAASSGETILLGPEIYAESFTLPDRVSLFSSGGSRNTKITGSSPTGTRVTLGEGSCLGGVSIEAPTDATPAILDNTTTSTDLEDVIIIGKGGSGTGIHHTGTGTSVYRNITLEQDGGAYLLEQSGGNLILRNGGIPSVNAGNISGMIKQDGGSLEVEGMSCFAPNVGAGLIIEGGLLLVAGLSLGFSQIGVHVTGVCSVEMSALFITSTSERDILIEDAASASNFHISSGTFDIQKFKYPNSMTGLLASFLDEDPGDPGFKVLGELNQGSHISPREANFGGGDSHTLGMEVLSNTSLEAGTWGRITDEMKSSSGSTAPLFPDVAVGNALYIGGDIPFPGIKTKITTVIVPGAGVLGFEYWNGSSWVAFKICVCDADSATGEPNQYAQQLFGRVGDEQVRWDLRGFSTWTKKTLTVASVPYDKYWVRVRVTSPISTIPIAEKFKIHTHRFSVNGPAWTENFGYSEEERPLIFHQRIVDELSGSVPKNGAHSMGAVSIGAPNIALSLNAKKNKLEDGAVDGLGGIIKIPKYLDTSRAIKVVIVWYPVTNNSGNVELQHHHVIIKPTDRINGSAVPVEQAKIIAVALNSLGLRQTSTFEIDASDLVPGDTVGFSFFRDGTPANSTDDTLVGNLHIFTIEVLGTFWR